MSLRELADRLAVTTCEVERISRHGVADADGNLGLFRVGRVVEAGKHPNADRLQLCRVDVGEAEPRQIVCGAWNFGAGATVAVALPGAVLPDGTQLEQAKLRGETSDGMILSESELELSQDHEGIMVLADGPEPGTPLGDVLPLGDDVLEIEVTGNRPDLLAVYGIAREVAAVFPRAELAAVPRARADRGRRRARRRHGRELRGCPRYIGRLFRDVKIGRVAAVAQGAPDRGRHALDLERRRRDELRHARARQPAARLRLRHACGREDRRAPGALGRDAAHARRRPSASSTAPSS